VFAILDREFTMKSVFRSGVLIALAVLSAQAVRGEEA
jgi:hypothetical protein